MPIGRISLLLLATNFLVLSLIGLLPTADGAMFRAGTELLSFTCTDGFWLDSWQSLALTLGIPLTALGIFCFLLLGVYSGEELNRQRNGASVATASWLLAAACTLLSFSFLPCNSFSSGFAEPGGSSAHRKGHLLLSLLMDSRPTFNLFYAFMFCCISYCIALGVKLLGKVSALPTKRTS
ncbi:hypothetical protein UB43_28125 [Pseudomonas sp. 21]|uniref:hypothetical protein n=1 Tax=unclassified Pseudomonas TaxID=196821 RepID=UPI0005EBC41C|nr:MULTISPECIES: hypothetical protein [unclassified Pseudomonas]KJJ94472.1 hypothetical protein UB43_28125 [Pseudomonas sp. 21]MBV7585963.1 hypothetical protein [Pseudomonas sp. PDM33]